MHALGVLVLCAVAACYSPGFKDCEITCTSGTCPAGFSCEQGVCRAAGASGACGANDGGTDGRTIDSPPGADDDGDMIANMADNCPMKSNADQANEDNDPFGDVCDPCPIGPTMADNMDSDMDGVGDGCEPEGNGMHRISVFEGFKGTMPPAMASSLMPANAWMFVNGSARVTLAGPAARAWMLWPQPMSPADFVSARYTIDSVPSGSNLGVGIAQRFDFGQATGMVCLLGRDLGGAPSIRIQVLSDPATAATGGSNFAVGQVAHMVFTRGTGDQYACVDRQGNGSASGVFGFLPPNANYGLVSQGVGASYEWVMIVSRVN